MKAEEVQDELQKYIIPGKKEIYQRFFKTGKGEYGEGDVFIGLKMPDIRKVSRKYKDLSITEIQKLLNSEIHEYRMVGLLILVLQFTKSDSEKKEEIYNFYLKNTKAINNWDLVDLTANKIVGAFLLDKKDRSILYDLASSGDLWKERIAMIATFAFIRANDFKDALKLAEVFLHHKHDLIHKASGWMLREIGKRDQKVLENFLDKNCTKMPRTMLRYSIEKFDNEKRKGYLEKTRG